MEKSSYRSFTGKDLTTIVIESKEKLILLIFTMEWLGINSMLETMLLDLIEDRDGIRIYQIDVEQSDHLAAEMGIREFPTTILIRNSEIVQRFQGLISKKKLGHLLDLYRQQ